MKRLISIALTIAMVFTLSLPAFAAERQTAADLAKARAELLPDDQKSLNIFTWTYYIPDEVVAEFEAATGIRVNYSAMIDTGDVLPKLKAGGAQFDIVACSDVSIADLVAQDLLMKLDPEKISTLGNINPDYQGQFYDPASEYSIPYTNTVPLIVYDPTAIDFEVTGFTDFWRPEFEGKLALIGYFRSIIGIAQKKLGYSFNDPDPAHLEQVREELKTLMPNIAVINDSTPHNALISGDAIAGYMYGSQITEARSLMPQLEVVYPAEGCGFGIDLLVMPSDAPHAEAAYIFLEYMLDGEVSAYASELINFGNCNQAATAFLSEEYLANDTVVIPSEVIREAEIMQPLEGDVLDMYNQVYVDLFN